MPDLPVACSLSERERADRLTVEPGDGPVWLELTGPSGTREFLEAGVDREK
jgi:hypothetical protein